MREREKRKSEKERARKGEREKERTRRKDRETNITDHKDREGPKRQRERPEIGSGVDIVATNVTAATVPQLGVTSSRPAFEEKRWKRNRNRKKERDNAREQKEREKGERERERILRE